MSLMQEVEDAMVAMYDAGQQNSHQYEQLARARSGLLSEPDGSPGYDRYATTARNNLPASSPMASVNDPDFGSAQCDCEPGQPCCLTSGELSDSSSPDRKLTWPSNGDAPPTRLFIIADDKQGMNLVGKVKSKADGQHCQMRPARPQGFNTRGLVSGESLLPKTETEQSVAAPQTANFQVLGDSILPQDFVVAMSAVDLLISGMDSFENNQGAQYTPRMCLPESGMMATYTVHAFPEVDINGRIIADVTLNFRTSRFGASTGISGEMTGKVGDKTIDVKSEAGATKHTAAAAPPSNQAASRGTSGLLSKMISTMGSFVHGREAEGFEAEVVDGSGVTLVVELTLEASAFKLEKVDASPDLKFKVDKFESSLSVKAEGTIDVVELAVAGLLSPAASELVQRARAEAMREGRAIRGRVRADVVLSAGGELSYKYGSGLAYRYAANDENGFEKGEGSDTFGGKVDIKGDATVEIHAEGEIWIVQAEAGARGSMHTAWCWEMRKTDAGREKRYYFEGLRARVKGYVSVGITSRGDTLDPPAPGDPNFERSVGGTASRSTGEVSQSIAEVGNGDEEDWSKPSGDEIELLEPTVPEVTGETPPWEPY